MKNHKFFLFLISLYVMMSCRSSQELMYLQDATNNEIINGKAIEYILKPGDILYVSIKSMNPEVNVLFNPESNMETSAGQSFQKYTTPSIAYLYGYELDSEGYIKLPMLGQLKLSGLPLSELESIVQNKADEFLNDAIVKVKLLNYKITVTGEVRVPGDYYNYNNSITLIEALAVANGNTDFASIKNVMVVRPIANGNKAYYLNLSTKSAYMSEAFYLQPNDLVIVQPDKYKNFQLNSQAYSLIISSVSILLAVLGFAIN